jgi:hypothetical protein
MGNPQITQIAQISFPASAASAKSADKTFLSEFVGVEVTRLKSKSETPHVVSFNFTKKKRDD